MSEYKLYLGDCLEVIKSIPDKSVDAVITDPPYGIKLDTKYKGRGRSKLAPSNDYPPIIGDDKPFDPSPFLNFRTVIMFGANYYANKLPISAGWLVWDKLDGLTSKRDFGFCDNADCELIWTNCEKVARIIPHRWMGAIKASERRESRVHPTQKPIALFAELIKRYTDENDTVFDPFMGSGSCGVAAVQTGRNFIGIEIDPNYFAIAEKRINDAQRQMRLSL